MKFKLLDKLIMLSKHSVKGIILQCLLLNAIWAADLNAQEIRSVNDVRIDLNVENASLSELFQFIENSTNFYFSFSSEDISNDFTYTNSKRKVSVRDVLLDVSQQADLKFKQVNRNIIVQKNGNNSNQTPKVEVVIQGITITGKVTSAEDDSGLPGANIVVKGTSTGTVADIDGNYTIEVSDANSILVFSSVGFITEEVMVGNQTVINMVMSPDITSLDEIVVVGYGEQKKVTVTGAVVDVEGDELVKSPAVDMTNSISGRLPGVVAIQTGGEPGYDGSEIKIRGTNTMGNAEPLIVIDGIPDRDGGFGRLSPQDIESISVLKDASAAIYGSRAANGAIIITTKRGSEGKPTVNFDMNFGWAQPVRYPEMSNAVEYATIMNEISVFNGLRQNQEEWEAAWQSIQTTGTYTSPTPGVGTINANYSPDAIAKHASGEDPWGYPDTDWFGDAFMTWAPQNRYNLTLSGGKEKVKYFASLGYISQDAIYKNSATYYKQYNARLNLDADISDYIKVNLGLMARREDRNFPTESRGNIFRMLMRGRPVEPEVWPNGKPGPDIENGQNPYVVTTNATGYVKDPTDYLQANGSLILTQPWIEGLKLTLSGAVDVHHRYTKTWQTPWELYYWDRIAYEDDGVTPLLVPAVRSNFKDPRLRERYYYVQNTNLTALLNYDRTFANDHNINILAGVTKEEFIGNDFQAFRRNYISAAVDQLFAGGSLNMDTDGSAYNRSRLGYYGRVQYNFKEKYLAEFIWRYDGSYIFPESKRFGFFPGLLLGWNLTNEDWFNVDAIDYLKIRGSYGQMGNDLVEIRDPNDNNNLHLQEYAFLSTYDFGEYPINGVVETTLVEALLANPDFTWETQDNYNIGLDATLFGNRIDLTLEWFKNTRGNMLIKERGSTPQSSGIADILPPKNLGKMENQGYEFNIRYNHLGSEWKWNAGVNGGYAKNKVIYFDEVPGIPDYQKQEGKPLHSTDEYLIYQYDGVFYDQAEIDAVTENIDYSNVEGNLIPGDMKFKDVDGNGVINADDRVRMDYNQEPTFNFGASFDLQWKNFDFSLLFQGATGAKFRIYTESGDIGNFLKYSYDHRWSIENPSNEHPRLASRNDRYYTTGTFRNDYYLFSKNYVRLKNIELGYSIPLINNKVVQRLRIYVNALNLATWDANKIFDPESDNISGTYYPQSRVINTGLSITF